ncbi:YwqJ-related putative deaminase [Streptomyces uncialis]|uniref:YwqJ-related putative deaminase n=1 Tax=Streptomyces uncialis TaxID=1048205 RepID=UPI00386CB070|nr:YwqJ-related putative deaminase [Streptomyces uncialis]
MGYTIPEGVDTMLDVVGVGWPNIDEDAYRDMADALREFADDADDDAHIAHGHVQGLLSSGQSESLTALDKHWKKVQAKNKDLADAARIIAGALDHVADIIVARKIAAVGELADLCATVGIALAAAPFTMGLTALLAGGKIVATRIAFKKILKEMAEAAVAEITAILTQPAVVVLESIVTDLVIQTAMNVTGQQDGIDIGQAAQAGKDGLQLNSAGPGPGQGPVIDHGAHSRTGGKLADVQVSMNGRAAGKIGKAKGHHGRAKGKDSLTAVLDSTIEGVVEKLTKGHDHLGKHVGKDLPEAIGQSSKIHRSTDKDIDDRIRKIDSGSGKDRGGAGSGGAGGAGGGVSGQGPNGRPLNPQPDWHGRSAGKMKHHRREALDVNHLTPEQQRAVLVRETRQLADEAKDQPGGHNPPGKDRLKTACAGGLLHDGTLTTHSSSTQRHGQKLLDSHPALQSVVDGVGRDIEASGGLKGAGHGKCAEIALVSDRLRHIEAKNGITISTPEEIRRAMEGSLVYSLQIGEQPDPNGPLVHGDYKPPCRSCSEILPRIGVTAHR